MLAGCVLSANSVPFIPKKSKLAPRRLSALDATTLNNLSTFNGENIFQIIFNKKSKFKDKKRKLPNFVHKKLTPKSAFQANYQSYWVQNIPPQEWHQLGLQIMFLLRTTSELIVPYNWGYHAKILRFPITLTAKFMNNWHSKIAKKLDM